jgi:imidazolonepropionase-like amidohydrolase
MTPIQNTTHDESPVAGPLRLDGATVVDVRDGTLSPNRSILIDGGRIAAITPTENSSSEQRSSLRVIDVHGKFVLPGYNDMHTHTLDRNDPSGDLALMLVNGITGFRQMGGSPQLLAQRHAGTLPVGRDAPAVLAMPGGGLTPINANSTASAIAEIRRQKENGADFIKVIVVGPEVFFAAIAEAKRIGLPIVGHLQPGVDAAEASRAGFASIEHLGPGDSLWISCSTDESALRAAAAQSPAFKAPPIKIPFLDKLAAPLLRKYLVNPAAHTKAKDIARLQQAFDTFDEAKCLALAARFVADECWQVPTLTRLRTQELADSPEYPIDPNLRYVPRERVREWQQVSDRFHARPATPRDTLHAAYQHQLALTKVLAEAGVDMMTGTDDGGWQVPGFALHNEFDELAVAGLSPQKILQMATLNSARFLGSTGTAGTVAVGKNADLVLLDADPFASVQNLHRIIGVVRAGNYYSRDDLDTLSARVEAGRGYLR